MSKMTITEGLATLKNINSRISKEISNAKFLVTYQAGKAPAGYKTVDDFVAKARSAYQSINDLIDRRNKIKSAIVNSNAVTKVFVGKQEYTVAAAIERKSSIELQQSLLNMLVNQTTQSIRDLESADRTVQQKLTSLLEQIFGKDVKANADDVKTITDAFMSRNAYYISDPLDAKNKIDALSDEINEFITKVDVALQISNATTLIEID